MSRRCPTWPRSASVHVVYLLALLRSYHHGDFSLAYPLARGSGALLAAIGGVALLDDHLGGWSWVAIGIVIFGVVLLVGPNIHGPTIGWALLTGATIGTYTLIDSAGARRTEGLPYGLTLIACSALAITLVNIGRGRAAAFRASLPGAWRRYALGGACTTAAYSLVLIAVRYAPVGYVATLRESSVLIAALLGWLVSTRPSVAAAPSPAPSWPPASRCWSPPAEQNENEPRQLAFLRWLHHEFVVQPTQEPFGPT